MQQALQGLHRIRSLWMGTRTTRINALRGFCREFGLPVPPGARTGIEAISRVLADPSSPVPMLVRENTCPEDFRGRKVAPGAQVVLKTNDRLAMTEFPLPAYELAEMKKYFLGSIQYSSGCPYQCEFCDIPGLYGRNPRLKSPQQIIAELDKLRECGVTGSVYFVDDNFIGNRKAALDLLPHGQLRVLEDTGYLIAYDDPVGTARELLAFCR